MKFLIIIKKELLDQIRDRRTIVAAILMPAVIVPLLLFLMSHSTSNEELSGPVRIIINDNESHLKSIILGSFRDARFVNSGSPLEAIINGKAELHLVAARSGEKYSALTIYYDSARRTSALSYLKIHSLMKSYFKKPDITTGDLQINSLTIRGEKENKTIITLSLILPVFLMVFAASSTMSSVIDMSSGEKERSTIETLLSCNISRMTIILGKISAASIIGITSVLSLVAGLVICSHIYPQITGGLALLKFSGLTNIMLMIIMASLSVFLFAAAGMAIGLYAKSVKEGTIITLPVIVLCSALSGGLIAGDPFSVNGIYLFVPILNFSYLIRSVIFNQHEGLLIMISVFVNLACAVLFIIISGCLLKRETVIFRS